MKNSLELLLLELLFNKKNEAPPTRKKHAADLTVKQLVKIMKHLPEYKKEFEDALKALEPKKQESKLTLGQKYMLWTLAAVMLPPLYVALIHALFTAISGK